MLFLSQCLFLVLLLLKVQQSLCGVVLSVKLLYFVKRGGSCCDLFCWSPCDLGFSFRILELNGQLIRSWSAGTYKNTNSVSFGYYLRVGSQDNPVVVTLQSWPGGFIFYADIWDWDEMTPSDNVAYFYERIYQKVNTGSQVRSFYSSSSEMRIAVEVNCSANYYGTNCQTLCIPHDDDIAGHYSCDPGTGAKVCMEGWTGVECNVSQDDCLDVICLNGGTCQDLHRGYNCSCVVGYTGDHCGEDVNECDSFAEELCVHGVCLNSPGSYVCQCTLGYSGKSCDFEIDECASNPCLNDATCHDIIGGYTCHCQPGFTGFSCGQDINECDLITSQDKDIDKNSLTNESSHEKCNYNGNCINTQGSYKCLCHEYWEGAHCELNVNECLSGPCHNNGSCVDIDAGFRCLCSEGFTGLLCDSDIDECQEGACFNNATCHNVIGGFQCECQDGWLGEQCQEDTDECETTFCHHNGTCVNVNGSFYCECQDGWSGLLCEQDVDECTSKIDFCQNGGTCLNKPGSYDCLCTVNWTSVYCEVDVNECALTKDICQNNGKCINLPGKFKCQCPVMWTGLQCETDTDECIAFPEVCLPNFDYVNVSHRMCRNKQPGFECYCNEGWIGHMCELNTNNLLAEQERLLADAYDQSGNKVYYSVHQTNINRTKALYLACSSNITSIDSLLAYFISIEQNNTKIVELQHTARLDTFENSQVQVYYPMIKMDGQILSNEEVGEYMQSKILNLTKYLPCHLTNVLHRSDTIYLYPIILVLCLLFFIFIVAVILVKYQRYTYHKSMKSKDTSLTNSVHSVFMPVYGASLSRSENKIAAFQDEKTESK